MIPLDPVGNSQMDPLWKLDNEGLEVRQLLNSDPGIAVSPMRLSSFDFSGSLFVDTEGDDDFFGIVFSFQSSSKFYVIMWKQRNQTYWHTNIDGSKPEGIAGISIKVVNSLTGVGPLLRNALWHTGTTDDQVKLLWHDPLNRGWKDKTAYKFHLIHRPDTGLIRMQLWESRDQMFDTGCLYDKTMQGGQIGLFAFSQKNIIWSDLKILCSDKVPKQCVKK